jgi:hypothetical protein
MVFVLKWLGCGTSSSACTIELKRARTAKKNSDFVLPSQEGRVYICQWQDLSFKTM